MRSLFFFVNISYFEGWELGEFGANSVGFDFGSKRVETHLKVELVKSLHP